MCETHSQKCGYSVGKLSNSESILNLCSSENHFIVLPCKLLPSPFPGSEFLSSCRLRFDRFEVQPRTDELWNFVAVGVLTALKFGLIITESLYQCNYSGVV